MHKAKLQAMAILVSMMGASVGLAGCRIDEHKQDGKENVKISTPFGGMSVKTDQASVQSSVGLDAYPGATLEKKENDNDSAADVNFNFGGFHLGVKAVGYTTPDAPDKVLAFYRGKMTKYGVVIQCAHDEPVGTPTRTPDGLTCDDPHDHHGVHVNLSATDHAKSELKAGSRQHQHIVSVEPRGSGTKFGLVMIDLPVNPDSDSDDKQ